MYIYNILNIVLICIHNTRHYLEIYIDEIYDVLS